MTVHDLPALNAALNAVAATLLVTGHAFVHRGEIARHRVCMLSAFLVSVAFLASYVAYHAQAGSVRFTEPGWPRVVYFTVLATHVPLAALIVPLALVTLWRALRGQFERHARIARWTYPVWLYVSVTGVMVYLMLYHLWPSSEIG
jgi:putative membrane protein